jgi:hypothetical protein
MPDLKNGLYLILDILLLFFTVEKCSIIHFCYKNLKTTYIEVK